MLNYSQCDWYKDSVFADRSYMLLSDVNNLIENIGPKTNVLPFIEVLELYCLQGTYVRLSCKQVDYYELQNDFNLITYGLHIFYM